MPVAKDRTFLNHHASIAQLAERTLGDVQSCGTPVALRSPVAPFRKLRTAAPQETKDCIAQACIAMPPRGQCAPERVWRHWTLIAGGGREEGLPVQPSLRQCVRVVTEMNSVHWAGQGFESRRCRFCFFERLTCSRTPMAASIAQAIADRSEQPETLEPEARRN